MENGQDTLRFEERTVLDPWRLMQLCDRNEWHIDIADEGYRAITERSTVTGKDVYDVALNIIDNSDMETWLEDSGYPLKSPEFMELVMSEITLHACYPLFSIKEGGGAGTGHIQVPVCDLPQLSDERWNELATENKRYREGRSA